LWVMVGKGGPVRNDVSKKTGKKANISKSKSHIELIAMLTVEVLKSVKCFDICWDRSCTIIQMI
jgi:hypothetical protein